MQRALIIFMLFAAAGLGQADHPGHGDEGHHDHAHHTEGDDHAHDEHDHAHGDDDHHEDAFADHKAELEGVTILHAWAQATEGDSARVFMEIENSGDVAVALHGADAHEMAESVTLMASPIKAGAAPETIGEIEIAPGTEMELVPTGLYLALDGLTEPLHQGDSFEMHVEIEPLGEIEIVVEVEAANAKQHSHAGHAH
ncbi:MAG: copper chaperone PCu(A)C [Pseudomonadota bacterium]